MAKNIFNTVQLTRPKRNYFDLTHDVKTTIKMGQLLPVCAMEAVPGDHFNISAESLIRFGPLVAPVMHRFDATIHYFFVPNRILWPNWEEFITGNDSAQPRNAPYIVLNNLNDIKAAKLAHALGCPKTAATNVKVNALPFSAYQKIYREYYRDQNLVPDYFSDLTDGDNSTNLALTDLRYRAWMHDYFTSCLPWAQKGGEVQIPLGDIVLNPDAKGTVQKIVRASDHVAGTDTAGLQFNNDASLAKASDQSPVVLDPNGTLTTEATSVNDLRRAFRLQEWLERNARAGTRYIENIMAHFGVKSSDKRLQRPEYITGIKSPVVVSEVLNTTGENGGLPQGNQAGHAIGVASGKAGSFFCEEHGWIIGIMSVMPQPAYFQGLPRELSKFDRFDYFWPEFANIGEQEVFNQEIWVDPTESNRTGVFGYIPRYAEYRYQANRVGGDFMGSLSYWHLAREFANAPALNAAFIECKPDDRIFAVSEETTDQIFLHVLNRIGAKRPLPKYGTPTI